MTPETWKRLGDLVEQALSIKGEAREEFLDAACSSDFDLREKVERFIVSYEQNKDFLEEPAIPGFSLEDTSTATARIGDYKIIRPLGKGGMGEVFLAQRDDGPVTHPVALKLIRAGEEYRDFTLSRFLIEQQILSELVHPNIARMLDAGTSDDGRPYFVMEYVDGLPITEYCDKHHLQVNERLKLFLQVCHAVQFAHHNLIVHRDLKPTNLLVTRSGDVKLLDFGIAKALSPWQQGVSALHTETGFRVLTPPYASPEQLTGNPITTSSDVYSLGILLYEMLTGRRPHRLNDLIEHEVVRVILEEEPLAPSSAIHQQFERKEEDGSTTTITSDVLCRSRQTTTDRLQRKLKGELDHIVLMALRKEQDRRYGSAAGLGEDIHRHLEGLPVEAQPDTIKYRVGKFVRRHRWGVAAAAAFVVLLTMFSIVTAIQSNQIRTQAEQVATEKDRVQVEATKSERVVQVLVDLFQTANPNRYPGADTLSIAEFLHQGENRALDGLEEEPEIQAKMKHVLGRMYRAQGDNKRAADFLAEALEQQRALRGPDDLEATIMLRNLASALYVNGQRDSSLALYKEVEERLRRSAEDVREELAVTLLSVAPRLSIGEREEKEKMLVEANQLIESLSSPPPMQRASVANQLGVFYYNQGLLEQSREPFEKALHFLGQAVDSTDGRYLVTAGNLGGVLTGIEEFDEAERLIRFVLDIRRQRKYNSVGTAFSLSQLGNIYYLRGDWSEAEAAMAEAYEIISTLREAGHWSRASYGLGYATMLNRMKKFEKAEELIHEAEQIRLANFGDKSVEYAEVLTKRGDVLRNKKNLNGSLVPYERSLEILYPHFPEGQNMLLASTQESLATVYFRLGRLQEALNLMEKTLAFRSAREPSSKSFLSHAQVWTGLMLSRLGRHEEAMPFLETGLPVYKEWPFSLPQDLQLMEDALKNSRRATLKQE